MDIDTPISGTTSSETFAPGTRAGNAGWIEAMRKLVAGQSIVAHLPERDLLALMGRSVIRTHGERQRIYRRGDAGRSILAVLEGYVKLSAMTDSGREVVLDIVGPGMCFGELAVLNNWPRDTDATTVSRCRLLMIDGREFNQVMERNPEGLRAMLRLVSERMRQTTERVLDSVALSASARLVKALMQLARLQGSPPRDGVRIDLKLSQTELGGMTGMTRESINKQLASLRDAGWISLFGGTVLLRDVGALRAILEEQRDGRSHDDDWRDYARAMPAMGARTATTRPIG